MIISITEEDMYRFISPLCVVWFVFEIARESLPIPCGPIFSCHPRSMVREEKNKEEANDTKVVILWSRSVKNHCSVRAL